MEYAICFIGLGDGHPVIPVQSTSTTTTRYIRM